ncbi:unnamed protein product [Staurois parvus]|uniref:Uncharacterized protein n=1 Tax=Staurois parvus TaxID=386267 RepID=A0ABN9DP33_9NEOB|nr:unnamed protein product [Staurois parvus]
MPHICTHLSCLSLSPINDSQCLSMSVNATYQCCQCPPISASQCNI